jgi:hypothetical protein
MEGHIDCVVVGWEVCGRLGMNEGNFVLVVPGHCDGRVVGFNVGCFVTTVLGKVEIVLNSGECDGSMDCVCGFCEGIFDGSARCVGLSVGKLEGFTEGRLVGVDEGVFVGD